MTDRDSILSDLNLTAVRNHLASRGYVAVLHWHRFGASHPTPLAFAEFSDFFDYLKNSTRTGDAIDVWAFPDGDSKARIAQGKIPDSDGNVPLGGAY